MTSLTYSHHLSLPRSIQISLRRHLLIKNHSATCSGTNVDFVKGLGVDEVIDYTVHESLPTYLAEEHAEDKFDTVLDTVGMYSAKEPAP